MKILEKILTILDGSKTHIGAIALVTIPFLVLKGFIDADTGAYFCTVIGIFIGGGKIVTNKVLGKAKRINEEE